MFANLVAFNAVLGRTSSGSVEYSGNPNDVILLTIGGYRYTFNSEGRLIVETRIDGCITTVDNHGCCATLGNNGGCCTPMEFKSED